MAKDERANHRLCQKLPRMPTEQGVSTPTLWAVLPGRITLRPMAFYSNGLHHETPNLGRLQPTMGNHRPIHQDGVLPPFGEGRKDGGRPSRHLCPRSMEASRPPH